MEIGAGNGINFGHYPATVDEVIAAEPEPYLRAKAKQAASLAAVRVTVIDAVADSLPLADGSVDAAVACLVLCSVPNQTVALQELRRVLRPGGELRFMEHVHSDHRRQARVQNLADRSGLWPGISGNCHCARNTPAAISTAGFEMREITRCDVGPSWMLTNPHLLGIALRPNMVGSS